MSATTLPNLPFAIALTGEEDVWVNYQGIDYRTTTADIAQLANGFPPRVVNLLQFGADPTGEIDSGPALQAALNFAALVGWPLYVPPGTYLLATRYLTSSGNYALCLVPTGCDIRIFGAGESSVFTIPNGFSSTPLGPTGDYSFFWSANTTPHGIVEISGIHIDGNGSQNLVVDSGTNLRRGYGFRLLGGVEFYCHDCYFTGMAGRNVLNIANNVAPPPWTTSRIVNNIVTDVGGAIAGNENQSDHSTLYIEAAYSLVTGNVCRNTNAAYNPFASPAHPTTCIEDHSARALITSNTAENYGTGGNCVAAFFDTWEQIWANNQFLGMKSNVVQPIAGAGMKLHRMLFHSNVVEIDNTGAAGGNGVLQNAVAPNTIGYLSIIGNAFYCQRQTGPFAGSAAGVSLTAVDWLVIKNNDFAWWPGNGVLLNNNTATGTLGIAGGVIDGNKFHSCGLFNSPWSIFLLNADATLARIFSNITIGPDNEIDVQAQPVGTAPLATRGINVQGPGALQNINVYTPRTKYISRSLRVVFTTATNNRNVAQFPLVYRLPTASSPTGGPFGIAGEVITHTDPAPSGFIGRAVTTAGSASEATWGTNTAYVAGQWIILSSNKVVMYTVSGTSDPATEPTPSVVGQQYTDGTATLMYMDTGAPVLKTYGAISA